MRKGLREKLSQTLQSEDLRKIYNSFDIIGQIAVIKTPCKNAANNERVAKQIMQQHKNIKSVYCQTSPIKGDFRIRELRILAGENSSSTECKEFGCVFKVDVEKCYFSPRLSYERSRIAHLVKSGETVVNMFSGVGCFSIIIAKIVPSARVYSIDVNPAAFKYMSENVRINKVYGSVVPILGDAKDVIQSKLKGVADRVLMPLPEKAVEYLPVAVSALKQTGGWIHFYDFQHATGSESPTQKTELKVAKNLDALGVGYKTGGSRIVRSTGPNWYQIVQDITVDGAESKF